MENEPYLFRKKFALDVNRTRDLYETGALPSKLTMLALNDYFPFYSSAIVDKYIGESARLIREMFNYARDHQPCIIFMDEIDAIGGRRFSEGTSADREIQRTLMELLNQMDGFDSLGQVRKISSFLSK